MTKKTKKIAETELTEGQIQLLKKRMEQIAQEEYGIKTHELGKEAGTSFISHLYDIASKREELTKKARGNYLEAGTKLGFVTKGHIQRDAGTKGFTISGSSDIAINDLLDIADAISKGKISKDSRLLKDDMKLVLSAEQMNEIGIKPTPKPRPPKKEAPIPKPRPKKRGTTNVQELASQIAMEAQARVNAKKAAKTKTREKIRKFGKLMGERSAVSNRN